jgi:dihydrofolate reductase
LTPKDPEFPVTQVEENMRNIIVSEYVSLDGVMEAPERWVFPYQTEEMEQMGQAAILAQDALLLGRVTYDIFASYWPHYQGQDSRIADHFNNQPKYVVSNSMKEAHWNHTTLIQGNIAEEIRKLKQQPGGDIGVTGSATLVQSLMQDGLVDELNLLVYPVVLGSGRTLFVNKMAPHSFRLVECQSFRSGVVSLTYRTDRSE